MSTHFTFHRILGQVVSWAALILVLAILAGLPAYVALAQEGGEATWTATPLPMDTPTLEPAATALSTETPVSPPTSEVAPTSEPTSESTETLALTPTATPEATLTPPNPDLNGDGAVNILDLTLIASHFGTNDPLADLNGNGSVDILDLGIIASGYGQSSPGVQPALPTETPTSISSDIPTLEPTVTPFPRETPASLDSAASCDIQPGANSSYPQVFRNAYERQGGKSNMGCATNKAHGWEGLVIQDFAGGNYDRPAIFHDENKNAPEAYVLWGPILGRYWGNSQWGPPHTDVWSAGRSPQGTTGQGVDFSDMQVYSSVYGTYVIRGVTQEKYKTLGGTTGVLGFPKMDGDHAKDSAWTTGGWYQPFEGGILHTYEKNGQWRAFVIYGAIQDKYIEMGGSGSTIGYPIGDVENATKSANGTEGKLVRFEDGDIYTSSKGTYVIRGVTRKKYDELGGTGGFLGFPENDGLPAVKSPTGVEGWYQPFEGGIIHTFEKNGQWQAFPVHGAIQAKYNNIGGSGSILGFPVGDEKDTAVSPAGTRGKYQDFEQGQIYYHASGILAGASFVVSGAIDTIYNGQGGSGGWLGLPISDEHNCLIDFEFGSIDCNGTITPRTPTDLQTKVIVEANYILETQYNKPGHPANGAFNNVIADSGEWSWIVPRENALAILGLIKAAEITGNSEYLPRAQRAADYLVRIQDSDGAWYNQYYFEQPYNDKGKSPTQTAEVMIALYKLGYQSDRWEAMRKGADYLLSCQTVVNKQGNDDGLIAGGKGPDGSYYTDRWTQDNAFGYQALKAAEEWAKMAGDNSQAQRYKAATQAVLNGINNYLYSPEIGVWHKKIDLSGHPDNNPHEWSNYAPRMLDVPAKGVNSPQVGEWIHKTFQKDSGAVSQNDIDHTDTLSPGFSFQASLAWFDLGQSEHAQRAINWAENSGLWCLRCTKRGGWIDWTENGITAPTWQRFIDTSFYAIAAWSGGYDFSIGSPSETYNISGRVTDANGNPISGVTISSTAGINTQTDDSGNYTLNGLVAGSYTVTPTKSGYTFEPTFHTVTVPQDTEKQNFVGTGSGSDKLPMIFIPGFAGSRLWNDSGEVWPNVGELIIDLDDDSLLVLRLNESGNGPFRNETAYSSVKANGIIDEIDAVKQTSHFYDSTVTYFTNNNYTKDTNFFVCSYDWRKDIDEIAKTTLEECIDRAKKNTGAKQVNILAHSMGGLIARWYISDPTHAQNIKRLVTLGTPYLGAPKMALAIIDGVCFPNEIICLANPLMIKEITQNFPGAYQLVPSDAYFQVYSDGYFRRGYGETRAGNYLDKAETFEILENHNRGLVDAARVLHEKIDGWGDGKTNGVQVLMLVGDGKPTIDTIIEKRRSLLDNPSETEVNIYDREYTDHGDGTVPLRSAAMGEISETNLRGTVPIRVFPNTSHLQLAQEPKILECAKNFFESLLDINIDELCPKGQINALTETEVGLTGSVVSLNGPVQLEILDNSGNRIGSVNSGGAVLNEIPGASYDETGSSISVFLPDTAQYVVKVHGQQEESTDVRIQKIVADQIEQTTLFEDVPVSINSTATLNYDPDATIPGAFELDQNGDGTSEVNFPPVAILDPAESQDYAAPKTAIVLEGTRSPEGRFVGQVKVTMNATDNPGGAGIAKIEYTLDNGNTVQTYTEPFTIDPRAVSLILAKATDRARNEEFPLASTTVEAEPPPTVDFVPLNLQLTVGSTSTTNMQVKNISNLYGTEFRLTYNPAIVQVVDADPRQPGIQIGVGNLFQGKDYFVARNQVNPTTGVIEFSVALRAPAGPLEGNGSLATITWRGRAAGTSALTFDPLKLSDRNGNPITFTPTNGSIEVTAPPNLDLSGTVLLQGRSVYSGTKVFVSQGACLATLSLPIPGAPSAVTDAVGNFKITSPPGRVYQCLWVVQPGYLVGQKSSPPAQGNLGAITLPGGDVNGDGVINIFDLAFMAIHYGNTDRRADVNADGRVDIFDLTIAAGNYNRRGPVSDWN